MNLKSIIFICIILSISFFFISRVDFSSSGNTAFSDTVLKISKHVINNKGEWPRSPKDIYKEEKEEERVTVDYEIDSRNVIENKRILYDAVRPDPELKVRGWQRDLAVEELYFSIKNSRE